MPRGSSPTRAHGTQNAFAVTFQRPAPARTTNSVQTPRKSSVAVLSFAAKRSSPTPVQMTLEVCSKPLSLREVVRTPRTWNVGLPDDPLVCKTRNSPLARSGSIIPFCQCHSSATRPCSNIHATKCSARHTQKYITPTKELIRGPGYRRNIRIVDESKTTIQRGDIAFSVLADSTVDVNQTRPKGVKWNHSITSFAIASNTQRNEGAQRKETGVFRGTGNEDGEVKNDQTSHREWVS